MNNKKWLIGITLILSVMSNNALAKDSESIYDRIFTELESNNALAKDSESIYDRALKKLISNNALFQASAYCNYGDTPSLRHCGIQNLNVEKDILDRVYKKLMSILDSNDKQLLKTSQLAWVDSSRKDCSFQTDWETGSMGSLMRIGCETGVTKDRRKNLENRLISELRNK